MYLEHFGLDEPPFRITPHTDFFFDGAERGATLEALVYSILHDEGIVKVSGEVGSGKTMLCRVLMERLPEHVDTIYLSTPSLGRDEILYAIADDLKFRFSESRVSVALRELQEHLIGLYAAGRRVVILIDEAHAMPEETLEQVRLLSNLESSRHKLLQIVLFGQPELDEALSRPSLRQLKDRITQSFRMRPLTDDEVAKYLAFRMHAAGYRGPDVFTRQAVSLIARASEGLTRRINILADKSLLSAFTVDTHAITARHARAAIADSDFAPLKRPQRRRAAYAAVILIAGIAIGVTAHWLFYSPLPAPISGTQSPIPAAPPISARSAPELAPAPKSEPAPKPDAAPKPNAAPKSEAAPKRGLTPGPESVRAALPAVAPSPPPAPPAPEAARLSQAQLHRIEARYAARGQPLLDERLAATRALLARAPDDAYTLEMYVTENIDQARVERFLVRADGMGVLSNVYVVPLGGAAKRLWVLFGDFPDRQGALAGQKVMTPEYRREFKNVPRSFAEIRHAL
ncbi:MAG TPA: AAA family ATPase [Burkholderiales bacterium]|nr:AAA family ATPase [Burkholderiales bacterium]